MTTVLFGLLFFSLVLSVLLFLQNQKALASFKQQQREDLLNLRYLLNVRSALADERHYETLSGKEELIFDGSNELRPEDFNGGPAQDWNYMLHRFSQGSGAGMHEINNGILSIHRTNAEGRYELHLKRFVFDGKTVENIPAVAEKAFRLLHLSCEVRRNESPHLLRFVFKGEASKNVHDEKEAVVFNPDWEKVNLYFRIGTNEACGFRIDDLEVLTAPSSIAIRNIRLWEKEMA